MNVLLALEPGAAANAEESERLALLLRAELREVGIHTSQVFAEVDPPERAKGVDPFTAGAGAVVLALSAPGGVLTSLVGVLQDWLGRQSARHRISVTIDGDTVDVEYATPEERRQLIDTFVRRHEAGEE